LHEAAAGGDQVEAVLERKGAGGGVGGEFTEGEPGGGLEGETGAERFQVGEEGESVDVKSGLAVARVGERFGRTFETDLKEVFAGESVVGFFEEGAGGGGGLEEVLAHADVLGTLSGKQKGNAFHQAEGC
jgi:hypothetical protein